jgi:hypothetical protein
MWKMTAA